MSRPLPSWQAPLFEGDDDEPTAVTDTRSLLFRAAMAAREANLAAAADRLSAGVELTR